MTEQDIEARLEGSKNDLLVESVEQLKASLQEQARLEVMIEEERDRLLSQFDSLVGQTIVLGGVASDYFDMEHQRKRGYEDYSDRYIIVAVPLAECEIVETYKNGALSAVRVVHPAGHANEQPYLRIDSLYFQ